MANKNNIQEPEEMDSSNTMDAEIIDSFNPLDEPVIEKAYTRPNVKVTAKDLAGEIPEPSFTPPPMTQPMDESQKNNAPQEPFNPQMKEMPKKDKMDAAEKLAKMMLGGYKILNKFVDDSLQFNERKLAKLEREGTIDLNAEIPLSPSVVVSAREFVEDYNSQTRGTIYVSQEFEDETMPVLTRVLAKRGVGMTDEQFLMYALAKDAIGKGFLVSQSLSVKKEILETLKEIASTNSPSTPPPPPPKPQSAPVETVNAEEEYTDDEEEIIDEPVYDETNVNDFVNRMTGSETPRPAAAPRNKIKILSNETKGTGKRGRKKKN
jgi:hypothetical protein